MPNNDEIIYQYGDKQKPSVDLCSVVDVKQWLKEYHIDKQTLSKDICFVIDIQQWPNNNQYVEKQVLSMDLCRLPLKGRSFISYSFGQYFPVTGHDTMRTWAVSEVFN